jgi:hypothetical protein
MLSSRSMSWIRLPRFQQFGPVAQGTWQWRPQSGVPALGIEDPLPQLEGRTMPDMLEVSALQLRNPVAQLVALEGGNRSFRGFSPVALPAAHPNGPR